MTDNSFYKDKKVFVTGHTGFKGSWLCKLLLELGAKVGGYALAPEGEKLLFGLSGVEGNIESVIGDMRDRERLEKSIIQFQPDIVIHMAAQPIVRESYKNPVDTYDINVMGTVNVMEAVRLCGSVRSVVNVTTDKVYRNMESLRGYVEGDVLDGYDPYSNSKSCSELVTGSYVRSFFGDANIAVSTCRAGNVLGGGDFSKDRIIPDCYRAVCKKKKIIVRNPESVRPYQHVLDPLCAYLLLAHRQYEDASYIGAYNIGPDHADNVKTGEIVEMFCREWGDGAEWTVQREENAPHEANYLYLDCGKAKKILGWKPVWGIGQTIEKTVAWYKVCMADGSVPLCMERQIHEFMDQGGQA